MKEGTGKRVIERLTEVIARKYKPEKIILFGSHAYGEPHEESDIDLLIIKKTRKGFFDRLYDVRRISSEARRGYAFEPVVLTPAEVNKRLRAGDQFIDEILAKGEVLYARQQGTQVFVYEKTGEIVVRPITDEYIEGMAGMTGTKGKLLSALKEEKAKERLL